MTDPLDLLTRCYRAGVRVLPHGDRLRLDGQPCPDDLKADLRTYRAAILATLTTHGVGQISPVRQAATPVGYVVPCANSVCPVLGPCQWVLASEPCPLIPVCPEDAYVATTARYVSGWETAAALPKRESI